MTSTIPQFRLPLSVGPDGDLRTVEQGTAVDTAQRIAVLVCTPPGWVDSLPDFGLYRQQFLAGGADIAEVERQISTYVPDADDAISEDLTMLNQALDILGIRVTGP